MTEEASVGLAEFGGVGRSSLLPPPLPFHPVHPAHSFIHSFFIILHSSVSSTPPPAHPSVPVQNNRFPSSVLHLLQCRPINPPTTVDC